MLTPEHNAILEKIGNPAFDRIRKRKESETDLQRVIFVAPSPGKNIIEFQFGGVKPAETETVELHLTFSSLQIEQASEYILANNLN